MRDYAKILEKAADLIEERGLAHGELQDDKGRLCAWGALTVVCRRLHSFGQEDDAAEFLITLLPASADGRISVWNDKAKKSAVVSKLRKAAVLARAAKGEVPS